MEIVVNPLSVLNFALTKTHFNKILKDNNNNELKLIAMTIDCY